ncbi:MULTISPECIES: esterase/lipase family protein [Nocardia]|uniref:esterase/lipase family protein n=1 Tax=Nocardia TaxID=1817 RepID=UPI001E3218D8|nr:MULTISPECIES: alpha/beta hydrolase [Nocardia]
MKTFFALLVRIGLVFVCLGLGSVAAPAALAQPRPATPDPVLVIGGFDADQGILEKLREALDQWGYSAFSMVLPAVPSLSGAPTGSAPIAESAGAVAQAVDEIRRETGAARVDLVGHSMGGLAARHYVKFLGGGESAGTYVDLGTPNSGQSLGFLCSLFWPGCRDIAPGSPFLRALNQPPAVPPGLAAYHLFSEDQGAEREPLPGAVNASVQDFCPGRNVIHRNEPRDGAFQELIVSALRGGPLATTCPR